MTTDRPKPGEVYRLTAFATDGPCIAKGNTWAASRIERVDVLCQCGWGRLSIPECDVPVNCPVCGYRFHGADDD